MASSRVTPVFVMPDERRCGARRLWQRDPQVVRRVRAAFLADDGFDPFGDVRREYFFTSPAWDVLRVWVTRHPRLAKTHAAYAVTLV